MARVFIAIVAHYHEGTEIVGVYHSREAAVERAVKMGLARDEHAAVLPVQMNVPISATYPERGSDDWVNSL